ncbi:MAG: NAD(P)H-hydrate dehydratase [Pikeienuella sp.]|uniref:NAD(P)H-hydrate dehydratase n=1 Tax=Pikeienuella sp. TaxID=2831957 RepID=UPI00391AFC0C
MEVLTAAEMRAIERAAIESGAVSGLELMERAGRGVVSAVMDWRPELAKAPGRAIVLCGPGNNGGDGFVVARLLKERGWEVEVFLYGEEAKLPPDAAENSWRWKAIGDVEALSQAAETQVSKADLVIDAFFGIGLGRSLPPEIASIARAVVQSALAAGGSCLVAVDVPSGLCADSGRVIGESAFQADLTVTFAREKIGHRLGLGPAHCGRVAVADIGLGDADIRALAPAVLAGPGHGLGKGAVDHKYSHGHALVLAGGVGKGGAARLAARGALRIGAGLVTVGAPPAALIENAARLDAIMLRRIGDAAALAEALEDRRINAVVLGPGLGAGEGTQAHATAALSGGERGVVLDADALTAFAGEPEALFALTRRTRTVLTPHMGEFGRLFPDIRERLEAPATRGPAFSKVDAAREAASRAGCVVLIKGPDTVVAGPKGRASIVSAAYERACPWLATAGAGDVLAGMIGGLLARGFEAMQAAESAAWLHQEAARDFGPGLIAEDIPEQLPAIFRRLGL